MPAAATITSTIDENQSTNSIEQSTTHSANSAMNSSNHHISYLKRRTVYLIDWDDTLLASSALAAAGIKLDSDLNEIHFDSILKSLKQLQKAVLSLLDNCLAFGEVHIVTNAEYGWVEMSASRFLPEIVPLLSRIPIISARSTYERFWPDSPIKWKYSAFHERLHRVHPHPYSPTPIQSHSDDHEKHVISLGDSYVEREAVRAVTRGMLNTRCKSVKFSERPSIEELRRQLELVNSCFSYIQHHAGDLDLQLTVTVTQPAPGTHASEDSRQQHLRQEDSQQENRLDLNVHPPSYVDDLDETHDSELGPEYFDTECNRSFHSVAA